jgi:hypothetical protein
MRRIARVTEQYNEAGGDKASFVEDCAAQDAKAFERDQLARERAYQRTGICNEQ